MTTAERTTDRPALAFYRAGSSGPRVLLVMGYCMPGSAWGPIVERLARDHRLLYFDHAGTGASDPLRRPVSMTDLARHTLSVFEAAGWDDAHVVGVSMGGMIAQELALRWPSRWRSLTLITTHAGGPLAWLPPLATQRKILEAQWAGAARRRALIAEVLFPPAFRARHPDLVDARMRAQFARRPRSTTRRWQLRAVLRHRAAARLHRLRMPTLVVRADLDVLVPPRRVDHLRSLIPHAELARFPEAGHGIIFQSSDALAARLRAHFAAGDARKGAAA